MKIRAITGGVKVALFSVALHQPAIQGLTRGKQTGNKTVKETNN
jgi:hypothetical protein